MPDTTPDTAAPEHALAFTRRGRGTAAEASAVLGISITQVYRLMDEGVIKSFRVGTRRVVIWDSVLALLPEDAS